MEYYHRLAIEKDSYSSTEGSFPCHVQARNYMACLDIGAAGTFSGNRTSPAIDWNVQADNQWYKNVSANYLVGSTRPEGSLFGVQCENVYHGDGVINSFDIGVLVFALFGVEPYDNIDSYAAMATIEQRPETASRCLTDENRSLWQVQLHDSQYCPPPPPPDSRRLSILDAENSESFQVGQEGPHSRSLTISDSGSSSGRSMSSSQHAVGKGFIRSRFTGHNAFGSWHGFEFAPNIVPVMVELMLHGVWSVGSAPLTNAPPPVNSDEVPFWPDRYQVRWSRNLEQKSFAHHGTRCNDIVSGATGTQTLIGDTLSVRQEGRGSNCPFWLYLWAPEHEHGDYQSALPGRLLSSHLQEGLQQVWAKAGSSAMTTTGPVMLNPSDDVEFDQDSPPPAAPSPPAAPPSIPAPPAETFVAVDVRHDFRIDGQSSEAVTAEIVSKLDNIVLKLANSLELLTGAIPKITITTESLSEHWVSNESNVTETLTLSSLALILHPRRALEHADGCTNGTRIRASIRYNKRVSSQVANQFKTEWQNAVSSINAQPCSDPEFEMLPNEPSDTSSQTRTIAIIVALVLSAMICFCGCCCFIYPWWPLLILERIQRKCKRVENSSNRKVKKQDYAQVSVYAGPQLNLIADSLHTEKSSLMYSNY